MSDSRGSRVERLAEVVVDYSAGVEAGNFVLIESTVLAAPLIQALYARVVDAGAHPATRVALDGIGENLLREGADEQLEWVNPARQEDFERADVRIAIVAPANTRSLTSVDPSRQALLGRAQQRLGQLHLERAARGELRWVVTAYPTNAGAQDAEMSLAEYEDFVYGACFLGEDEPAESWRSFAEHLTAVAGFLEQKRELRVVAEDTDLTVGIHGRHWIAARGRENLPDGEVFTGPVETSLEGTIRFSYPAVFQGRAVNDVRLRFERGEVVDARAAHGEDFLRQMIGMDEGARRVGEFAFGLNDNVELFTRNILFDEKIGGTIHLALGSSYPETGGVNRSGLHWDMICDLRRGSEVYADGDVVYRDGRFVPGVLETAGPARGNGSR